MTKQRLALFVVVFAVSTEARAHEYLSEVASEVVQAPGSAKDLASRAKTCMAQHLASGSTDSPLFVNTDLETGTIVALSVVEYGSFPIWKLRSTFTFEARDGRFRITQTNIQRFIGPPLTAGWSPIGKWAGSGWQKAENAYVLSAANVTKCILDGGIKKNW